MGMTTILVLVLLALHLTICIVLWLLHRFGLLKVDGHLLPFMMLVPLWGSLSVMAVHSRVMLRGGWHKPAGLEELRIEDQERRSILMGDRTDFVNTVPLEEALIVNNPRQRRSLMLSILDGNPSRYVDLLSQARLNEDAEVVHYAATAMAHISAKEDIELQNRMAEYLRDSDSDEALGRYRTALEHYLASSMVQGYDRTLQTRRYADLLGVQLKRHPDDRRAVCALIKVQIDLGDFSDASRTVDAALAKWPRQGDVWLMKLRLESTRRNGAAVQRIIRQIEREHIYLGGAGRDALRFWTDDGKAVKA